MAKLSSDGKYVTVERGDTLTEIAVKYAGGYSKYKQLATINNIKNPNLIYIGQKIYLTSKGGTSSTNSTNSNKPTINQFGVQSNVDGVLFATWSWNKSNTESFKVLWTYDPGNGVWFEGSNSTVTVDADAPELSRQSTYSIPAGARKVCFKVKPISAKKKVGDKETSYWTANWSDTKTWTDSTPLETPGHPTVTLDKYTLTAALENVNIAGAKGIEFEVIRDNSPTPFKTGKATIVTAHVSYSCSIEAGSKYKVRCRAYSGSDYSEWSQYSNNENSIPVAPAGITTLRAVDEKTIFIEWAEVSSATRYEIEYATKKEYLGSSGLSTTHSVEGKTNDTIALSESGEYFFRVRSDNGTKSDWCEVKSVKIGEPPAAPTTWSSSATAVIYDDGTADPLKFFWVHNSIDGSSETWAKIEKIIDGTTSITLEQYNDKDDKEKDTTSEHTVDLADLYEGAKIEWRVCTSGVLEKNYGEWSIMRTVNVYKAPSLELGVVDVDGNRLDTVTHFPIRIKAVAGPPAQAPIGYHVSIISGETYETVDNAGNVVMVNRGDEVFSRFYDHGFDHASLDITLSAGDLDLETNATYTAKCIVSMDSGLTAEAEREFAVLWEDRSYEPNAEISIDYDTYAASIRPYCAEYQYVYYEVTRSGRLYLETDQVIEQIQGTIVKRALTDKGHEVYYGTDAEGVDRYYCQVENMSTIDNMTLAVYRREFDGSFTEIASGIQNAHTTVVDPHPSLDYARYRIVATDVATGAVSYYDLPGYPVNGKSVIIQWDEAWSSFDVVEEAELVQPAWVGSLLKLPYNIDVSDGVRPDVSLVEYIGRVHPVAYYGTQLGASATWNVTIPKTDRETLYALRRLSRWMGNVYVREPSGSGYWANIVVTFSQKHLETTIPVSFNITRVEGGI